MTVARRAVEADAAIAEATALHVELAQLRAENARLRRLLGLEDPTRIGEGPTAAWSPSLFPDRAEPMSKWAEIDRGSPREAKLARVPVPTTAPCSSHTTTSPPLAR